LRQLRVAVVPCDPPLPYHFAESQSVHLREFGPFAEGERSLSIERDGKLGPEPLRNFRLGNAEAPEHRVRDIQGDPHAITIQRFAGQTPVGSSLHAARPARRRHQQEPARSRQGRRFPPGSLLPPQRHPDRAAPPIRERPEDILPLARFFIEHYNRKFRRGIEGVSPAAGELLLAHDWPGNVRELRNAIERAMILEESTYITPPSLPIAITRPDGHPAASAPRTEIPTEGLSLEDNERMLLSRALGKTGGNQTQAARLLRITRDTLRYKMKKFNLR